MQTGLEKRIKKKQPFLSSSCLLPHRYKIRNSILNSVGFLYFPSSVFPQANLIMWFHVSSCTVFLRTIRLSQNFFSISVTILLVLLLSCFNLFCHLFHCCWFLKFICCGHETLPTISHTTKHPFFCFWYPVKSMPFAVRCQPSNSSKRSRLRKIIPVDGTLCIDCPCVHHTNMHSHTPFLEQGNLDVVRD